MVPLIQTFASGQKKAERQLMKGISEMPGYTISPGILDYREEARRRYGVSPTQSSMYKRQMSNIQRAGATGLAGAGSAKARLATAPSIVRQMSDASLAAEGAAEAQQTQKFGELGRAQQLLASQEAMKQQRDLIKSQQMIAALSAKAAGRAAVKRAGLQGMQSAFEAAGKIAASGA